MDNYRSNKLVTAVQGAMGTGFHVKVVEAAGDPDGAFFQLEAVELTTSSRHARSDPYRHDNAKPISELIGLCANTLKTKLQTHYFGQEPGSRAIW